MRAVPSSSSSEMKAASEVFLSILLNSFPSGGMMTAESLWQDNTAHCY